MIELVLAQWTYWLKEAEWGMKRHQEQVERDRKQNEQRYQEIMARRVHVEQ